jgi:hypothetical protein
MNVNYIYEYASLLERVLSTAYKYKMSLKEIERRISYNYFFQLLESDDGYLSPIIEEEKLINQLFPEIKIDLNEVPNFDECLWMAEAYLRIQLNTGLTFESIFLYVPIVEMHEYYSIYHECDFNQIIDLFNEKYNKVSVLALLIDRFNYQISDISLESNISHNTLYSLKQRRRDIKKVNVELILKLARMFKVRVETISEIRLNYKNN